MVRYGEEFILSIDPGTFKCGIAVVNIRNHEMVFRKIVHVSELLGIVEVLVEEFMPKVILIGDGTGHKFIRDLLTRKLRGKPHLKVVPERNTTMRARQLFVSEARNPLEGLIKFLKSFFVEVDDLAAYIIALDYLMGNLDRHDERRRERKENNKGK